MTSPFVNLTLETCQKKPETQLADLPAQCGETRAASKARVSRRFFFVILATRPCRATFNAKVETSYNLALSINLVLPTNTASAKRVPRCTSATDCKVSGSKNSM